MNNSSLYHFYDLYQASLVPARISAQIFQQSMQNPLMPAAFTSWGRSLAASAEIFERTTRRFGKPAFGLYETIIDGKKVDVAEQVADDTRPFCNLIRFKRRTRRKDPKVLLVAPISGHYATLLRGTVEALLPHHDVYITDWADARQVPLSAGRFNLDDYIDYLIYYMRLLGPDVHLIAVCQPAVPVFAAVALMNKWKDPKSPTSMTLMGGPIDPRVSKTAVTELAEERPLSWFENNVTTFVPWYYPGAYRRVYPGFLQLGGFMSMNLDRHVGSYAKFYEHLVKGDGENAARHRTFYNEYLAVMDLPAEFYLQTVEIVFQKHLLPQRLMKWKDPATDKLHDVDPWDIKYTALMTIEGELDDISARGQTYAAHGLCKNLLRNKQFHHLQMGVGHYGIFNGKKWRYEIMPRVRNFIRQMNKGTVDALPQADLAYVPDIPAPLWNGK